MLQKGYNNLVAMYKGKENTPEGANAIAQGQNALQMQMNIEQQAILAVLQKELAAASAAWRAKNPKFEIVVSKNLLLDSDPKLDKTN